MRCYMLSILSVIGVLWISGSSAFIAASERPPLPTDHVHVVVSKHVYSLKEPVVFKIINSSARTIYYTFGCTRPLIYKVEGDKLIPITTDILESIPDVTTLKAGETCTCQWDKKAWQDLTRGGRARFEHYYKLAMVPSGRYRFRLDYYVDELDVDLFQKALKVYSQVFTIR